jgi:hypothetical protein
MMLAILGLEGEAPAADADTAPNTAVTGLLLPAELE